MAANLDLRTRRKLRQRYKIKQVSGNKMRLSVYRTNQHTYAQVIDPSGNTICSASTLISEASSLKNGTNINAAKFVGSLVAERAKKLGVEEVVFDRSGFLYHGRIKALADAAREAGLKF
ncbi:MAG: 50S ribosomal protein L18 [Alphaproteobacteria bacterium]|nr:50S ribosomal protein L18 [Alphaproteobacteria bacterium]